MRRRLPTASPLAVLALLCACGCGHPDDATLRLGWRFVDGRGCAEAGATTMHVDVDCQAGGCPDAGFPSSAACADGLLPSDVPLALPGRASTVTVAAISGGGDALYRGAACVPAARAGRLEVTLYYTASP